MKSKIHELQKNNLKIVSKKFMFSAFALVAFSFAGMANTGGEEKLYNQFINSNNNEIPWCVVYAAVSAIIESTGSSEPYTTEEMAQSVAENLANCNELEGNIGFPVVVIGSVTAPKK